MSDEQKLLNIRDQIDQIDEQILSLVNARAKAAETVAKIKLANDPNAFFYRPERESQVIRGVQSKNQGPLSNQSVGFLFREIMSMCLALEQPMTIGFLGPQGTFSQEAALKFFGHAAKTTPLSSIKDVFHHVEAGDCTYGTVPVENSTEGMITHTLDLFLHSDLKICGEVSLRIHQNLMSKQADFKKITTVYSHQQSLAQCRNWLSQHLSHAQQVAVVSNAEAAKLAQKDHYTAAIAGEIAAEIYQLDLIAKKIEDEMGNTTRFLIIGKQAASASGLDKTSLLLSTQNIAGGLYHLLQPFAENKISMTKIESRPSKREKWDYVFFVDIEGHIEDKQIKKALKILQSNGGLIKICGSYPQAVI